MVPRYAGVANNKTKRDSALLLGDANLPVQLLTTSRNDLLSIGSFDSGLSIVTAL